jgi:hypothetical protein
VSADHEFPVRNRAARTPFYDVVDTIGLVILLLSLVLLSGMSGAVAFVAHLRRR